MTKTLTTNNIAEQIDKLPENMKFKVSDFVNSLIIGKPKGVEGKNLLKFEGAISEKDIELMSKAIKDGCEKVDDNEW